MIRMLLDCSNKQYFLNNFVKFNVYKANDNNQGLKYVFHIKIILIVTT